MAIIIHTKTSAASPFVFTAMTVAGYACFGLLYVGIMDAYISVAIPSPFIYVPIIVLLLWVALLAALRREITVTRKGIHITDSLAGHLLHERVYGECNISNTNVSVVSRHWYAFVRTPSSGKPQLFCMLRTNSIAAVELKSAIEHTSRGTHDQES